ncbi:MAG: hypothetical protein OXT69_01900 [Candidatus Poribacteria bacterium]|nr:hypothetical protein [Candidatus Poribacteria bacterium]
MTRIQQLTAALLCAALFGAATASAQIETSNRTEQADQNPQQTESALRRFEIVTLTALPFTAAHSYFLMKGYRSIRAGSLAAPVKGGDWNVVIAGAAVLAAGIGFYDYYRMKGKDRNESLLPEPPPRKLETDANRFSSARFQAPLIAFAARF